jgi:uncharacterized membrane protein
MVLRAQPRGLKTFKHDQNFAEKKVFAANLGLYNGFSASGIL